MSTLVENVQKVKSAHAALSASIEAKGVSVPAGTKLTDMPALVEQIPSAPAQTDNANLYSDSARTSIDVPGVIYVDFTKATNINACFLKCTALTSLTLPEGFGTNAIYANSCFAFCSALTSLTLPEGFGKNVRNANFCFSQCNALTSLTLPEGFGTNATAVNSCFAFCSALTSLTLPEGFSQNMTTAFRIFYKCEAMTSLHLPSGFGQKVKPKFVGTFDGCLSLETITGNPVFNVSLNLSESHKLTHDSIMVVINGLQTVTTTQTLTLGETNLAKLSDAEKKIATDKGWTLA